MIRLSLTLAVFCKVYASQTDGVLQPYPLKAVHARETVTLECFPSKDETENIYWYKLIIGQKPHLIVSTHKYSEPYFFILNSTRFKIKNDVGINHLTISQTELSDTAMYYCGVRRDYGTVFGAGVFLTINGSEGGQSNSRTVVQLPVSDPVHPGDSVTLQCAVDSETCAGEHSVYWFRHGSGESLPGLIYTHGNRSDECEKSPEAGSPTHSCVYSLPKRNLSPSDAGIYYCAVLTCGHILFGNGTKLDIKGSSIDPVILGQGVLLVLCVIIIIVLVCTRNKKCCQHCTVGLPRQGHQGVSMTQNSSGQNHDGELLNYAALQFAEKRPRNTRNNIKMKQESVYSDVVYTERQ